MSGPVVLSLRCPGCGGRLDGSPQGVLFWCRGCRGILEVAGGRFVPRKAATAGAVQQGRGRLLYLPVWGFRVRAALAPREGAAGPVWQLPEWVYVTAFALSNGFYYGDPGLVLTQRRATLAAAEPAPAFGGTRGLEGAKGFVEPELLALLDRRADVTGLSLAATVEEAVLWGIPYYDDGLGLTDGIMGLRLPGAALEEIGAIRAFWEGRG